MLSFGRAVKACYGILWLGTAGRVRNVEDWKARRGWLGQFRRCAEMRGALRLGMAVSSRFDMAGQGELGFGC